MIVDIIYFCISILLIFVCATFTFIGAKAAIEYGSLLKFFVSLLLALFSFLGIIFCTNEMTEETETITRECISRGYDVAQYNDDSWYCVRYSEPDIIKLEGEQ